MFAKLFVFCSLFFLWGCGSSSSSQSYQIAVDPSWYPLQFDERQSNVLGFATELLMDVSKEEKISLSLLNTNWDTLLEGLNKGQYQAILSSLYPYNFNENLYSFSDPFLKTGPILITSIDSSSSSLKDFSDQAVGVLEGSSEALLLEKDPSILIRTYPTIPDALNDLVSGNIQATLLPGLMASSYVKNLYFRKLKVVSKPLDETGLRLVTLKDKAPQLIDKFNKALHHMEKNGDYEKLLSKWNLSN